MVTREKGVETMSCPSCEADLKLVEMPDGSVAAESCSNCYSEPEPEKASKKSESREKGTTTSEEK
jgi:hypothetical protein